MDETPKDRQYREAGVASLCSYDRDQAGQMIGIDVEASIVFFLDNGGGCDCEVLLNVDRETVQ